MQVKANTSDYTIGRVLSVKCKDRKQRLVAFIFKSINLTERNYKIHNKEMIAVIRCLEVQRHYLERAKVQFEIQTDHKNLQYFITSQKLNHRQARQTLYLSSFDFILKHIPGKSIEKADGLSRRPNWQEEIENDNKDRILIKSGQIQKKVRRKKETLIEKENLKEKIRKVQKRNKRVVKTVEKLKWLGMKILKDEKQSIEKELVLKENQIYVPEKRGLRTEII